MRKRDEEGEKMIIGRYFQRKEIVGGVLSAVTKSPLVFIKSHELFMEHKIVN